MSGRGRLLLTGASGFVGGPLAAHLVRAGWRVRVPVRRAASLPAGVEVIEGVDLSGRVDWSPLLEGIDAIVHGAGIAHAGPGLADDLYRRVNLEASLALGEAAAGRVGRFVFLSSIRAQSGPTAPTVLTESDPPRPTDAYGRSKLAAEEGLARLGLSVTSLRPVVVYGPGAKANLAALLRLARLPVPLPLAGLTQPRSLLALENLLDAVTFALDAPEPPRGPFIVSDPRPTNLAEMVAEIRRAMGRRPMLFSIPPRALSLGFRLLGREDAWDRISGPMAADPSALLRLGWRPPAESTTAGLRRWLAPAQPRG